MKIPFLQIKIWSSVVWEELSGRVTSDIVSSSSDRSSFRAFDLLPVD
jgi:hypothetical protein